MKTVIRDPGALRSIGLYDLAAYLRAKGWREQVSPYEKATIWTRDDALEGAEEVLLPKSDAVHDYPARIADVIAVLEEVEDRPQLEIARDLMWASADVIRLRHPASQNDAESIRISDGVALIENARNMLFSAASTAVAPRRVLPPRRPPEAIEYMQNVRLGQTERGSYVVTVISRVAPLLTPGKPGLLEMMDEPFPRVVTKTLSRALRATREAAAQAASSGRFDAFENALEAGVSANLCDSIVGMARSEQGTYAVSIGLYWAPTRPVTEEEAEPIIFRPDSIPIVEEASRLFREEGPYEDIPVTGVVVNLHRASETVPGTATVACVIEGKSRQLAATLDNPSYHLAVQAHDRMVGISFHADVSREGRTFKAENVRDLKILEE